MAEATVLTANRNFFQAWISQQHLIRNQKEVII